MVREFDGPFEVPWDRAHAGHVAERAPLRGVDLVFLARAVEHYRDHPEPRQAIGTQWEYESLAAAIRRPTTVPGAAVASRLPEPS